MIKLKFDYTDIKKLRELLNISQEELACRVPISKSYLSMIESGRRGLSMENYKRILEVMNMPLNVSVNYDILNTLSEGEDINSAYNTTVLNKLNSFLEKNINEWYIDGIIAFNHLIRLYLGNDDRVFISSLDYPIYENGEDVSSDYLGKILVFDRVAFERFVLDDNFDEAMSYTWSIPTKEGISVDLYLLDSKVSFDNNVPIKAGFFYKTKKTAHLSLCNITIKEGSTGRLDDIVTIEDKTVYILSFPTEGNLAYTYSYGYNSDDIEVVIKDN